MARRNPDKISIVADNMIFCAITGNEARGLAMVERHLSWVAHDNLNARGQMNMLVSIGLVLQAVVRAGYGQEVVRGADAANLVRFFGEHHGQWKVEELVDLTWEAVDGLAQGFDARNQNTYVSDQVRAAKALLDERYDLPVVTEVFLPPAQEKLQPRSPEDHLALAEVFLYTGNAPEAVNAARAAFGADDPLVAARALHVAISGLYRQGEVDEAERCVRARGVILRETGRVGQADLEARVGLGLFGRENPQDLQALRSELDRLGPTPGEELADVEVTLAFCLVSQAEDVYTDEAIALLRSGCAHATTQPPLQASALIGLIIGLGQRDDIEGALELVDQLLALPVSDGCLGANLLIKARLLGGMGRYDEGALCAEEGMAIFAKYSLSTAVIESAILASALLHDAGRPSQEIHHLRYALREAEQAEVETMPVRFRLGRALIGQGHNLEGIEILWEVLVQEEEAGAPLTDQAETCEVLAEGFEQAERFGNAVSMFLRAAEALEEAEQPVGAANMLRRAGNILRAFNINDEALDALARAWDLVQGHDTPWLEISVLEAYALIKAQVGDGSAVADMDQAIHITEGLEDGPHRWKLADLTDSKARVLMALDRDEEAVGVFLQASQGYLEAEDPASAARDEHLAAQGLAGSLKRTEEAIPLWQAALDHLSSVDDPEWEDLRYSILIKLSDALDTLGRTSDAAQIRSQIKEPETRRS